MKKLLCMILVLITVMSLCACGKGPSDPGQDDSSVSGAGTNQTGADNNVAASDANGAADTDANVEAVKAALTGTWLPINKNKYEDGSNIITFHEDGTVDMLGETYTWEVTSARSAEEGYLALYDGETKFYTAEYEIKDKVLNYLCFERVKGADDKYRLRDEHSIYAAAYYKESDFEIIEINSDNFADYFEMKEFTKVSKDSFGDITKITIHSGIVFKEEYGKVNLSISTGAFEYTYLFDSTYEVTADQTTGEYTYGKRVKAGRSYTDMSDCQKQGSMDDRYGVVIDYTHIDSFPSDKIVIHDEVTVTRAIGTLYVYTPAE